MATRKPHSEKPASAKNTRSRVQTSHIRSSRTHTQSAKRKRPIGRYILIFLLSLFALGAIVLGVAYATIKIPTPDSVAVSQKTTVYYNDGVSQIGSFQRENREIISCSTLPDYVENAVVASENRTFWTDSGIDLKGIARALVNNVSTGTRQGGSTITQQYAERYYLGETKSYIGKVKEALLALKIAQTQDKNTVLCGYMNTIYFGRGAYGIQAAAHAYFNKDAKDLTVSEAALLAGIIPAPSAWDPAVDMTSATKRFTRVIRIMKEDGYIKDDQAASATMPETIQYSATDEYAGYQGYLLTMVKDELIKSGKFTEDQIMTGGYKIITTLDKDKQAAMQQVASHDTADTAVPDSVQSGGMSADVDTGEIIAVFAGEDYLKKPLNNATQASYQPGSTMKVFTLLGAAQDGTSFSTLFNGNSPRTFQGLASAVPNFGNESFGNINLYTALAQSVNTVFVDLNTKVTPQKTAEIAKKAGITSTLQSDSLYDTLGIDGVHLNEIVQAYQTIAHDGVRNDLHIVRTVTKAQGTETVYTAKTTGTTVFAAHDAQMVTSAMRRVITSGTGKTALSVGKTLAGKSGTANDSTAVSFAGYSRHVVTAFATWNQGTDGSAQELPTFGRYVSGSGYATHLFTQYMTKALASTTDEAFPTVKDTGIVGGKDGTWGLGSRSYSKSRSTTQNDAQQQSQNNSSQSGQTSQDQSSTGTNNNSNDSNSSNPNSDSSSSSGTSSSPGSSNGTTTNTPTSPQTGTDTGNQDSSSNGNSGGQGSGGN
ncbi:transglycosylase domain-containing protein [Alloscardovia venturai]|uniref:Transglycosylase domain-containing protein n=1 Tax=Alloscardovia venturai TaxID=1769421 RepID=A0ABW2Y3M3_9BIFI